MNTIDKVEELRLAITDVLMTPNQAYKGMKYVPIELLWGLENLIDNLIEEQVTESYKKGYIDKGIEEITK